MNNKAKSQRKTLSIPADANLQQNERLGLVCNPKRSSHEPPSAPAAMAPAPNEQGQTLADQLLVAAAKAGDANAFFELSNRHSSKLLRAAYRITSNWHDAEDALQEALLSAFTHIQGFEGRSSFSSWLTRIIMNSAYMIMRKKRGHVEIPIEEQTTSRRPGKSGSLAIPRRVLKDSASSAKRQNCCTAPFCAFRLLSAARFTCSIPGSIPRNRSPRPWAYRCRRRSRVCRGHEARCVTRSIWPCTET